MKIELLPFFFDKLFTDNPVLGTRHRRSPVRWTMRRYFRQRLNWLDLVTIFLFFPMFFVVIYANNEVARAAARLFLSMDCFLFYVRFLQIFLLFRGIGIIIVMIKKSVSGS
jgi:hypothetical protein